MQQYQQFWHNKLSHLDSQFQLDYDTFIEVFSQQIYDQTSIVLTDLQKQIIKSQVDPQNKNQVYKNGYLLFIRNFWSIASQRTKFFNMKINLSKLKGNVQQLAMAGWIKIKVSYPYAQDFQQITNQKHYMKVIDEYMIKKDTIILNSSTENSPNFNLLNKQVMLTQKGFIKLGSSTSSHIIITNPYVNHNHLKIIYSTNLHQIGKSSYSFEAKKKPLTDVYIRDVSNSNRTKYVINNENNYFIVKNGMRFGGIGLMNGLFQIVVDSAPSFQQSQLNSFLQMMNQDRQSYIIGQPDKPLKVVTNFNYQPIDQSLIRDLFQRNLFYPQNKSKSSSTSKPTPSSSKQQKAKPPLKLRVINTRTLQQQKYDSKSLRSLTVGRDKQKCQILIDHISIRPIQFSFQMINQIWFVRQHSPAAEKSKIPQLDNTQKYKRSSEKPIVSVYLSKDRNRNSNRLPLSTRYPEILTINNHISIQISAMNRDKNEDQIEDDDDVDY